MNNIEQNEVRVSRAEFPRLMVVPQAISIIDYQLFLKIDSKLVR
jgi:hypothetical protein